MVSYTILHEIDNEEYDHFLQVKTLKVQWTLALNWIPRKWAMSEAIVLAVMGV